MGIAPSPPSCPIMGINLLITAAVMESRGPIMESGIRQPPLRGLDG